MALSLSDTYNLENSDNYHVKFICITQQIKE